MTIDQFNNAKSILERIQRLKTNLKDVSHNSIFWELELSQAPVFQDLLPDNINEIYRSNLTKRLEELEKEFESI